MLTIDNLPDEILKMVLRYITWSCSGVADTAIVCRRWHTFVMCTNIIPKYVVERRRRLVTLVRACAINVSASMIYSSTSREIIIVIESADNTTYYACAAGGVHTCEPYGWRTINQPLEKWTDDIPQSIQSLAREIQSMFPAGAIISQFVYMRGRFMWISLDKLVQSCM